MCRLPFTSAEQRFSEILGLMILGCDYRGERDEVIFLRVHRVSAVKCAFEKFARAETILRDTDRVELCATRERFMEMERTVVIKSQE